jgi:hypothetical protein
LFDGFFFWRELQGTSKTPQRKRKKQRNSNGLNRKKKEELANAMMPTNSALSGFDMEPLSLRDITRSVA